MAEIPASLVKQLREKTSAGMMDCKKALVESGGDLEAAFDWLRKKGLSAAAEKAGRIACEGLVGVYVKDAVGAMVEVNSETDFVARNEAFQAFVRAAAAIALAKGGVVEQVKTASYPGGEGTVADELTRLIATLGENLVIRRSIALSVSSGIVASYVHNAVASGLGRIGVLVAVESDADAGQLADLGKRLAMHVAATNPEALSIDDVAPAALERERAILVEQARITGKPEPIIEKMGKGRLRKYYQEVVLTEQTYVVDGQSRVGDVVEAAAKALGVPVAVVGFERFSLGEGIARERSDLAAEAGRPLAG